MADKPIYVRADGAMKAIGYAKNWKDAARSAAAHFGVEVGEVKVAEQQWLFGKQRRPVYSCKRVQAV